MSRFRSPKGNASIGRGFVQKVALNAADFPRVAFDLFTSAPILDLRLLNARDDLEATLANAHLLGRRSIDLANHQLTDEHARLIAASPHLTELRYLDLGLNHITEAGLEALAASTGLPKLVYLDFRHNKASDPTPQLITESNTNHGASYPALGRELQARHANSANSAQRSTSRSSCSVRFCSSV